MPFLFVDYDQGAGGEYLCHALSLAKECVPLKSQMFDSGRTKVIDVFNQEFLKNNPKITNFYTAPADKYVLVPTHQKTSLASKLLQDVNSIRIQQPKEKKCWNFLKHQQITKVLLRVEPTDDYFVGQLRYLKEEYNNQNFLARVDRNMDNLSLILLAEGLEPTDQSRQEYLNKLKEFAPEPEPDYPYDLTISYEQLLQDPKQVVEKIKNKFGISANIKLFEKFRNEFDQYQTSYQ